MRELHTAFIYPNYPWRSWLLNYTGKGKSEDVYGQNRTYNIGML